MPLLGDSKSVYVGTTPITKVMAGRVEVWPKGPPLPLLPACPTCKFWQPSFWQPSGDPAVVSNAMLIPAYKGDKSNRFKMSPGGIDVTGLAVRYALSDDKPLYDSMWTNTSENKYRCDQDNPKNYQQFSTYSEAINNQESTSLDRSTAIIDLEKQFLPDEISRLWVQVSYEKAGYKYNWVDVEYSAGNYETDYTYISNSQYKGYYGGFYIYKLTHIFECIAKLYSGNMPSPDTSLIPQYDVEDSKGVIRDTESVVLLSQSPVLSGGASGTTVEYMNRYQQQERQSFQDNAPSQVFVYKMRAKDPSTSIRSDRALCDVPAV